VTAFAPPDAAALAGIIRNPSAKHQARTVLAATGYDDPADGDVQKMARIILASRVQYTQEKAAGKALRRAQRDDGESFRWESQRRTGRGGY
jgi:hypothetical protein